MPVIIHEDKHLKVACSPCIKGHRSNKCVHIGRLLIEVRKPGRPLATCPHDEACNGECSQQPTFIVPGRGERARCDDPADVWTNAVKSDKRVEYPKTARKEAQRLKTRLIRMKPQVQHAPTCGAQSSCGIALAGSSNRIGSKSPNQGSNGIASPSSTPSGPPSSASPNEQQQQQQEITKRSCCGGGVGNAAAAAADLSRRSSANITTRPSSTSNYLPQTIAPDGSRVRLSLLGVRGSPNGGVDPVGWQCDWPIFHASRTTIDENHGSFYTNLTSTDQHQQQFGGDNVESNGGPLQHTWDSAPNPQFNNGNSFPRLHSDVNSSSTNTTPNLTNLGESTMANLSPTFMPQAQEPLPFFLYGDQQQAPDPWSEMPTFFRAQFNPDTLRVIQESVMELTQGQQGQCTCDVGCRCVFCAKHPYNPATLDEIMSAYNYIKGNPSDEGSGDDYQNHFQHQSQQSHSRSQSLSMTTGLTYPQQQQEYYASANTAAANDTPNVGGGCCHGGSNNPGGGSGVVAGAMSANSFLVTPAPGLVDFASKFNMQLLPDGPRPAENQIPPGWLIR